MPEGGAVAPRLFATRELPPGHPWRRALEAEGFAVTAYSLLAFEPVTAGEPPACDWVFVYSRTGARFGAAALAALAPETRVAAMGPGTAEALRAVGRDPDFVGAGDPGPVAAAFATAAGPGARVAFVQAANSRRSVERLLGDRIRPLPYVVYRSRVDPARAAPPAEAYLLTSPLNAEAALAHADPSAEFRVLGETTAAWCRARGLATRRWTPPAET